jgi:hypothetical protein
MLIFYVLLVSCIWPDLISRRIRQRNGVNFVQISEKVPRRPSIWLGKRPGNTGRPNSPRPGKMRQVKSKVKSILIIFFDIKEIVHKNPSWKAKQSIPHTTVTFTATAWNCVKTSPRNLATKQLAVASRQRTISHFLFTRKFVVIPTHPTFLSFPYLTQLRWSRQNRRRCWTPSQNTTSKMDLRNGRSAGNCVYAHRRGLLRRWWWSVGPKLVLT